jgi:HK97 family phage prohead protease
MTTPAHLERRYVARTEARVAARGRTLVGYAALFNVESRDLGGFVEVIRPGAFRASLADPETDVRAFFDHDTGRVLGRQKSGTLRVAEDERGLRFEIDAPDTTDGRDAVELIGRGDLDGTSFAFRMIEDEWTRTGRIHRRELVAVDVFDVSVVTFPAYPETEVALRSLRVLEESGARRSRTAAARRRLSLAMARGA